MAALNVQKLLNRLWKEKWRAGTKEPQRLKDSTQSQAVKIKSKLFDSLLVKVAMPRRVNCKTNSMSEPKKLGRLCSCPLCIRILGIPHTKYKFYLAHLEQMFSVTLACGSAGWVGRPWLNLLPESTRVVTPSILKSSRSSATTQTATERINSCWIQQRTMFKIPINNLWNKPFFYILSKNQPSKQQPNFTCKLYFPIFSSVLVSTTVIEPGTSTYSLRGLSTQIKPNFAYTWESGSVSVKQR